MYTIVVTFKVNQEKSAEFKNVVIQQGKNSLKNEDHCLQFDVCQNPDDTAEFLLFEVYTNETAFQAHVKTEHFDVFDKTVAPWVISKEIAVWTKC